jgi:hypothetical protein
MAISDEITRLITAKANIKASIEAKGVSVDSELKLDNYYTKIDEISGCTGSTPNPPVPYVRPADWIDISEVGDNEINLLVTETTGLAFSVNLPSGTYSIDWGDGNTTTGCSSGTIYQYQHTTGGTWSDEGYYTWKVRIFNASSTITRWQVRRHNYINNRQVSPILWVNFGTTGITDYTNAFYDSTDSDVFCYLLQEAQIPSFANCQTTTQMFRYCYSLKSVTLPTSWGSVTNVSFMFNGCSNLTSITLPTSWGSITNVGNIFSSCYSLNSITLPTSWGNVENAIYMLHECYNLNSITLPTSWGNVTNVNYMFQYCRSLNSITLPTSWGNITNVKYMFQYCGALNSITLPILWDSVTAVDYMFGFCYSLSVITLPTSWGNMITTTYMFQYCYKLSSIILPTSWGSVENVRNMFQNCYTLKFITLPSSWGNISSVGYMFLYCYSLNSITLPTSWGSVTTADYMFQYCHGLSYITLPSSWGNVGNVSYMFQYCYGLKTIINTEYLGTTGATQCNMTDTFQYCDFLSSELNIASRLTKIGAYGASGYVMKLTSIRLTNSASTFTGTSPQINVSYTSLGQEALVALFNDLPTLTSKTINITGCPGAALLTAGERAIATGKGWTIIG